jgi:magnesium-transporting ATPase (P-type)
MDAEFIVPGDVLMVRLGDIVPADIKLLGSDDDEDHAPMQVRQNSQGCRVYVKP